jgi:uncharacterized protein (UPF0276 family)
VTDGVDLPDLGVGIIFFPGLEPVLQAAGSLLDVIEVEPQPISRVGDDGRLHLREDVASFLAAQPQAALVHSVGAPVAGTIHATDMLVPAAEAVAALHAPWASEHLNFDRFATPTGVEFANFLLPALQSPETVALAAGNIRDMRSILGVPVAVETPVNYLRPYPGELSDGEFLRAVAEQADCGILLDLHNLMCNERNGRQAVLETVAELPVERVWEIHLAGGQDLDGYHVDAHSGLIEDSLWDLAEHVIPRLPNLKAINFEIMPEYVHAGRIATTAIAEQLERMKSLWSTRGTLTPVQRSTQDHHRPNGLPEPERWECAVGARVTAQAGASFSEGARPPGDELATDPGVAIYQRMISSVRCGVVVDALRLTYRLLVLEIGSDATDRLLLRYVGATGAQPIPEQEIRQFAEWLPRHAPAIPHLDEVAAFEIGVITAHTSQRETTVPFTREPLAILESLGAGRRPDLSTQRGDYAITVTP